MTLQFSDNAWEDYLYRQQTDKKMLKRINDLINAINAILSKESASSNRCAMPWPVIGRDASTTLAALTKSLARGHARRRH